MPTSPLRVALAQRPSVPCSVAESARSHADVIARAADRGAKLVVFPELSLSGYELGFLAESPDAWIAESDPRLDPIRRACEAARTTAIVGGALREADGARVIAAPVIGPHGDVVTSRKENVHSSEVQVFRCGAAAAPFDVDGWTIAIGICFDAAHPRHAEAAARAGADVYEVSALYVRGEERRCDLHLGARAMDNRVFSLLANYAGRTGGGVSLGASGAWGPDGDAIARAPADEEALFVVDLDPAALAPFRAAAARRDL